MNGSIKGKFISGTMIVLISISLIGCSTMSKSKDKENKVGKNVIEQQVGYEEKEKTKTVTEEIVIDSETVKIESIVEKVEDVIELPIDYPFGIEPIVKSAKSYNTFDLIVVHTADTYGKVTLEDDCISFSKFSTMVKYGRDLTQNILVLDAGNSIFSLPIINKVNLSTSQKLQDLIGYDAIAPQSMAFNSGTENLFNLSTDLKYSKEKFILSSNILDKNNYLPLQPYQLYDFNGFIVCVVGLTSPFTSNLINQEGYTFDSNLVFENAQYAIDIAKQYSDYVVVIGSMGSGDVDDIYNSSVICSKLDGIDLFIDGQYSGVKSGSIVNGALIVNTKSQLKEIGVVDILISDNEVKLVTPIIIKALDVNEPQKSVLASNFGISTIVDNQDALRIIKEGKDSYTNIGEKVVAKVTYPLSIENKNIKQTSLSHLLTDYIVQNTKADVCMLSSSLLKNSINKGDVTLDEIGNAMPTFNRLCYSKMSGQDIFDALELSYGSLPDGSNDFIQTNIKVIYNKYADLGDRIIRAKIGKDYIDKNAMYLVMCDDSLVQKNSRYNMGEITQYLYYSAYYLQMALVDKFGSLE